MNPITLYDTTLRDGAQGEGINFSVGDKLKILQRLDSFGINYVEGGWPGSNVKDVEFFREAYSLKLKNTKLAAFGCTRRSKESTENDPQVEALLKANTPVVTIFGKVSRFHVENILKIKTHENIQMIFDTVSYLRNNGKEVIFDGEHTFDGFVEDSEFTLKCFDAAFRAGASHLVMCDTNGGTIPELVKKYTMLLKEKCNIPLGIHTHDDSGLAVANAVASILRGATQIQGTINGFGERSGNCNLVTTLAVLQLKYSMPIVSDENLSKLRDLSLFVDEVANQHPNKRAPFVGSSAFAHKGGVHVNAVKKNSSSYEHIDPFLVGNTQRILVGELSGRSNIELKAAQMGIKNLSDGDIAEILKRVKEYESYGYEFEAADASFGLLIKRAIGVYHPHFTLNEYRVSSKLANQEKESEAFLSVFITDKSNGQTTETTAKGYGPVDALSEALSKTLIRFYPELSRFQLVDYKVRIIDSNRGTSAVTRVFIEFTDGDVSWSTVGVSADIIEASWHAIRDGVEHFLSNN